MNNNDLIDSHCHLDFDVLYNDLLGVLKRAEAEGVTRMLTIGTNFKHISKIVSMCETHHQLFFATGIHPNQPVEDFFFDNKDLMQICSHKKMIGVGETGLDLFYSKSTEKEQTKSLIKHIEVAKEVNLPVIIHTRNADHQIKQILHEQFKKGPFRCLMHCFSSSLYLAESLMELDFYFSMSGIITFKSADSVRQTFSAIPIDRVLVETDSPYLSPAPHRGKSNEPAFVSFVAKKGAELFGVENKFFRHQTTKNFFSLFSKASP